MNQGYEPTETIDQLAKTLQPRIWLKHYSHVFQFTVYLNMLNLGKKD